MALWCFRRQKATVVYDAVWQTVQHRQDKCGNSCLSHLLYLHYLQTCSVQVQQTCCTRGTKASISIPGTIIIRGLRPGTVLILPMLNFTTLQFDIAHVCKVLSCLLLWLKFAVCWQHYSCAQQIMCLLIIWHKYYNYNKHLMQTLDSGNYKTHFYLLVFVSTCHLDIPAKILCCVTSSMCSNYRFVLIGLLPLSEYRVYQTPWQKMRRKLNWLP